jgi:hypothetical protein
MTMRYESSRLQDYLYWSHAVWYMYILQYALSFYSVCSPNVHYCKLTKDFFPYALNSESFALYIYLHYLQVFPVARPRTIDWELRSALALASDICLPSLRGAALPYCPPFIFHVTQLLLLVSMAAFQAVNLNPIQIRLDHFRKGSWIHRASNPRSQRRTRV